VAVSERPKKPFIFSSRTALSAPLFLRKIISSKKFEMSFDALVVSESFPFSDKAFLNGDVPASRVVLLEGLIVLSVSLSVS
jgi:hypothetical protein